MKVTKKSAQARAEAKKRQELEIRNLNQARIDEIFGKAMMNINKYQIKPGVEDMYRTFDRIYDKKDRIGSVLDLKRELDEQHQRAIASFSEVKDGIIAQHLANLEGLSKQNEIKIAVLRHDLDRA